MLSLFSPTLSPHGVWFLIAAHSGGTLFYKTRASAMVYYVSVPAFFVAYVIHMAMAMIWYHPRVFGNAFTKLAHGGAVPASPDPAMKVAALGTLVAMPFFSFILSVVNCRTAGEGALWGIAFGFFFDAGLNVSHSFFEDRPFALFILHRGYHIASLGVVGTVLGAMCSPRISISLVVGPSAALLLLIFGRIDLSLPCANPRQLFIPGRPQTAPVVVMVVLQYGSFPSHLLACFIHLTVHRLWYSDFLFGPCVRTLAFPNDLLVNDGVRRRFQIAKIFGTILALPFFVMLLRKTQCPTANEGLLWGIAFGLFDFGLNACHNLFEKRPFQLFLVHRGYHIVSLAVIGYVLGTLCGPSFPINLPEPKISLS